MGRPITNAVRDERIWQLYCEGKKHSEIAAAVGISWNASSEAVRRYKRLHAVREALDRRTEALAAQALANRQARQERRRAARIARGVKVRPPKVVAVPAAPPPAPVLQRPASRRPESPRSMVLRLSTRTPPLLVREIARATGLSQRTVRAIRIRLIASGHTLTRAPTGQPTDSVFDASGERCACGLRLPCNNCLPSSAAALADQRSGAGPTYPSCLGKAA